MPLRGCAGYTQPTNCSARRMLLLRARREQRARDPVAPNPDALGSRAPAALEAVDWLPVPELATAADAPPVAVADPPRRCTHFSTAREPPPSILHAWRGCVPLGALAP
jgi:hypothetical protein